MVARLETGHRPALLHQPSGQLFGRARSGNFAPTEKDSLVEERLANHKVDRDVDNDAKKEILSGMEKNRFCRALDAEKREAIIATMKCFEFKAGETIMKQDEPGSYFFVVQTGALEMSVDGKVVEREQAGSSFGGVALLYKNTRTASVVALEPSRLWGADGAVFREIIKGHSQKHHVENRRFLDYMSMFDGLTSLQQEEVSTMALFTEHHEVGRKVLQKGVAPHAVYMVRSGKLSFTDIGGDDELHVLKTGDCFGWRAVLYGQAMRYDVVVDEVCDLVGMGVHQLKEVLGDDLALCLMQSFIHSVMRRSAGLQHLPAAVRQKLAESMEARNYGPGEEIDTSSHMIIFEDGHANGTRKGQSVIMKHRSWCAGSSFLRLEEQGGDSPEGCAEFEVPTGLVAGSRGCRVAVLTQKALLRGLKDLGLGVDEADTENDPVCYLLKVVLLRKMHTLKELSTEQLDGLVSSCELMHFTAKQEVVKQGDDMKALYMLTSGEAIVRVGDKLKRKLVPGTGFGERGLLFQEKQAATVEVVSDKASFWVLEAQAFSDVVTEDMKKHLQMLSDMWASTVTSLKSVRHVRLIGKGAFGSVRLVEHVRSGVKYALKRVKKEEEGGEVPKEVAEETSILAENVHPFLLQFFGYFETPKAAYLLTELITGGQLFEQVVSRMGLLGRKHTQFYVGSLVLILESLHERAIVYRDLKPENVMLDDQGYLKLVDFGLAKRLRDSSPRTFTFAGTLTFMAPEVIEGTGYGTECDNWSLGVMMYELVCGRLPFGWDKDADDLILADILEAKLEFPEHYNDLAGKKLIEGLLTKDAHQRLGVGAKGWEDVKGQKFFKQGVSGNLFTKLSGRELRAPWVPDGPVYSDERKLNEMITLSDEEELAQDGDDDGSGSPPSSPLPGRTARFPSPPSPSTSASGRPSVAAVAQGEAASVKSPPPKDSATNGQATPTSGPTSPLRRTDSKGSTTDPAGGSNTTSTRKSFERGSSLRFSGSAVVQSTVPQKASTGGAAQQGRLSGAGLADGARQRMGGLTEDKPARE